MIGRRQLYVSIILTFFLSQLLRILLGVRFVWEVLFLFWQYLDVVILKEDLLRGIYYLHSQPPLFNFFLGTVLKVSGQSAPLVFNFLFQMMALGLLLSMAYIMEKIGIRKGIIILCTAIFALLPAFIVYSNFIFYTLPAAFLLTLSAAALIRFMSSDKWRWAFAFWVLVASLTLARATHHVFWMVGAWMICSLLLEKSKRRKFAGGFFLALLLTVPLLLKNHFLVGSPVTSSWLGMNFARGWITEKERLYNMGAFFTPPEAEQLAKKGVVSRLWPLGPFQDPEKYAGQGYFRRNNSLHPAIGNARKNNGKPNFNHSDYARISQRMLQDNKAVVQAFPSKYVRRIGVAYAMYMQPGPGVSWAFTHFYDFRPVLSYRDFVIRIAFGAKPEYLPEGIIPLNLLMLAFPLLILYGFFIAFFNKKVLFAYLCFTLTSVMLTCVLIELGENDRMRWETDPFLLILFASFLNGAFTLVQRRVQKNRDEIANKLLG